MQAPQLLMYHKRMQINFLLSSDGFLHVEHDYYTSTCHDTVHPLCTHTFSFSVTAYTETSTQVLLSGNTSRL